MTRYNFIYFNIVHECICVYYDHECIIMQTWDCLPNIKINNWFYKLTICKTGSIKFFHYPSFNSEVPPKEDINYTIKNMNKIYWQINKDGVDQ